jgi:poly(3-hydroxybutyrate) depolymerase
MRKLLVILCVFFSTVVSAQQIPNSVVGSNGVFIGFWEYKPADYALNPSTRYPVIIFLHGIAEKGTGSPADLAKITGLALPRMIAQGNPMKFYWNGKWETFIVISPQLSNAYGDWSPFYVEEMIKHATTTLRGDPNRVFLTGLSLGGGAVFRIGGVLANKLAGIAPVCPTCQGINWQTIAAANLPVWTFHAKDDAVASWNCSQAPVNSINSYNPLVKAKATIWPDGNHWIWDRAYDPAYNWQSPNLYEWFLGQNKLSPGNAVPVANAGPDITIGPGGSATFNASNSYDADGGIVRYVWKRLPGGPGGGELGSPSSVSTSVTGMWNTGVYEYELTVCDSRAATSTDRISVNVVSGGSTTPPPPPTSTNQAPVARAGNDATITLPTNSITLNGGTSSDADGSIIKYEWKQVSGPSTAAIASVNGTSTTVNSLVQGSYTFRLTIWDDKYMPAGDDVVITVNAASASTNQAPVARAGNDASITLPTNSTTLNASGSSDADGSIIKYEWKQVSGPSTAGIASVNGSSTGVSSLVQGTYTFRVTIWDDKYMPAGDDVVITVNAATTSTNQAPVARAGNDVSVSGTSTTLNGSGSTDGDGSIIKYQWSQVSGPSTASIASVNGASTGVSSLNPGTYTFRLTIWDNKYEPSADDVVITVSAPTGNQAPVARAGNDATIASNTYTLNGTSSSDADGSIIKYQWTQVSGPSTASIASVNGSSSGVSGLVQGTYYFRLTIWDNKYEPSSDDVVITVTATSTTNQAPVARAGNDASITLPTNSVTLNGSSSSDADGSIIKYQWTQVSGPSTASIASVNGSSTGVSGMVQGTYYFRLTIWDNKYEPSADDIKIEVNPGATAPPPSTGNLAPVSKAGNDISITLPTSSVNLSGAGSYDPDGTIVHFEWRKVSGPAGGTIGSVNKASTSISGLTQGTYTFALRVWDNQWLPVDDQIVITVNAAPATAPAPAGNQAPVSKAGNDVVLTLPTNWVTLNGSGSYDPDGTLVKHEWRKESGPATYAITNVNVSSPILSNLVAGTYTFVLRVWDNQWMPSDDKIVITVNSTATGMASTFSTTEATAIVEEPLSVSPNPAVSYVILKMVSATMGTTVVNIYDVNGRVVKQATYNKSASLFQQQIDISGLQAGTYTAEVIINNSKKSLSKFIKQ